MIETKLNSDIFYRVFPPEQPATDTLKALVRVHSEALSKRVIEMVKLWDQKIVNLRSELNMEGIQRRLGKMVLKEDVTL
jgi:hypothetical protein